MEYTNTKGRSVSWTGRDGNIKTGKFLAIGYKGDINNGLNTYAIVIRDADGRVVELSITSLKFAKNDIGQ